MHKCQADKELFRIQEQQKKNVQNKCGVWYNKMCKLKGITPSYTNIKINETQRTKYKNCYKTCHGKLHNQCLFFSNAHFVYVKIFSASPLFCSLVLCTCCNTQKYNCCLSHLWYSVTMYPFLWPYRTLSDQNLNFVI